MPFFDWIPAFAGMTSIYPPHPNPLPQGERGYDKCLFLLDSCFRRNDEYLFLYPKLPGGEGSPTAAPQQPPSPLAGEGRGEGDKKELASVNGQPP